MPTLEWIGKKAVVNWHRKVPFRLLRCDPELSVGDAGSGNLLVQGDNLEALKALLPHYAGKVKCIYIDPPYNTGNEGWVYNDAVNSPEMREWLGKAVGREAEDLSRHDKWLCMMYPRLCLLHEMLADDGAIFVSIDDNEIARLHCLMEEVFGSGNFVANIIWQKRTSPDARLHLGPAHDFVVVYARDLGKLKPSLNRVPPSGERTQAYKNPDNDPRGPWASVDLTGQTGHATPDQFYEIMAPSGTKMKPPPGRCWALAQRTLLQLADDKRIWFGTKGNSRPRLKKFLSENEGVTTWTWWPHTEVGHNQEATKELNDIMGRADVFENPKPSRLVQRILQLATKKESIVLDSFAGTGTTAQAVLQLNRKDGGTRRFILVEMDKDISENVTIQRLRNYITKDKNKEQEGDGVRFCRLGAALFTADGKISDEVRFADLARHVFFVETGEPLPEKARLNSPFLGAVRGVGVYLLYNGILKDKSPGGGNVLTRDALAHLPSHDGPCVIYGTACRLSPKRLAEIGVTFRQIPYEVRAE